MADRSISTDPKGLKGKLSQEAFASGEAAHAAGKRAEDCPSQFQSALARAWRAGWAAADLRTRPAEVAHARPEITERASHEERWPDGRPLPKVYWRPPVPCESCRLVTLANGCKAAAVEQTHDGFTYFRCNGCGHRWKLVTSRDPH